MNKVANIEARKAYHRGIRHFWNNTVKSFSDSANDFQLELWFGGNVPASPIQRIKMLVAMRKEAAKSSNWFLVYKVCACIKRECGRAKTMKMFKRG